MQYECLILTEDLLEVGAIGIHPELDHASGCMKAAGDIPAAFALAGVTNINNHKVRVVQPVYQISCVDLFDTGPGGGDHLGRCEF